MNAEQLILPTPAPLLGRKGWVTFLLVLIAVCLIAPLLNLLVPQSSMFHMSDFAVLLVGKIMCFAICALAMDLIWGYTGILSLGHGLFFALGGYAMGMYLMRQIGLEGNYQTSWCFLIGKPCHGIGREVHRLCFKC
jgi:urea transport system permease protein